MNILGTEYKLITDESLKDEGADGVCRGYTKEIRIRPVWGMLDPGDSDHDKEKRFREVMRHEITHAFLYESGLEGYADDETLVEWIARQYPKLTETFKQFSCAEE